MLARQTGLRPSVKHQPCISHPVTLRRACITSSAKGPDVVCVGEGLFDLIATQKGVEREKVKEWISYAGGAPLNVATSLGKLGVKVLFVSALGKDDRGRQLLDMAKARNVDLSAIQLRDDPTRDVYVTLDNDGDRTFAGFGLDTTKYSDCFLDADKLPLDQIKNSGVLVTGTLGLAYPDTRKALTRAMDAAHEGGSKVLVDINWRPVFWPQGPDVARQVVLEYLSRVDIIKISDSDLEWLLHTDYGYAKDHIPEIMENFPNARGLLLTAGGAGAGYGFRRSSGMFAEKASQDKKKDIITGFIPAFKVDVVDTTGAGDAFTAGFIYRMLEAGGIDQLASNPDKLNEAVVFAASCGALIATRKGAIDHQPSLPECLALFNTFKAQKEAIEVMAAPSNMAKPQ